MNSPHKISYTIPEAVAATGLGRTTIYGEVAAGRLLTVKVGARTLIAADDLRAWLDSYRQNAAA